MASAEKIQAAVERVLLTAWKKGEIDRSDEDRMPLLRNTAGFSRRYAQLLNQGYHKEAMRNEVARDLGWGMIHRGAKGTAVTLANKIASAIWKIR